MSFVQLDEDTNQLRVFMPPVKKLPPNPHIARGTEPLRRARGAPSETSYADSERPIEPRENKSLRHLLIACDQVSFLTGSASADLQAAHLITAVRSNPERKMQVEDLLTRQGLFDSMLYQYLLDFPTNAILLEASLRVHWDVYGTFCIVPSESDAKAMLDALTGVNTEWAKHGPFVGHTRPLDITQPPFVNPHWEIVVLHPHALLPNRQPLIIASDRTFYVRGQPVPTPRPTWTHWIAYDDHLRSATPPHDPLPPFIAKNVRATLREPVLSSLAMVINAHYKLDQFMREHGSSASPRVRRFAEQMSHLVTAMFYLPARDAEETGGSRFAPVTTRASQSAAGQHTLRDDQAAGSAACDTTMDSSASPGEDMTSDAVLVEPPEAVDDDDGLTDTEFRLVASKVKDPRLDPKERADAAMMLLFGTRQCASPYDQSPRVYDGAGQP